MTDSHDTTIASSIPRRGFLRHLAAVPAIAAAALPAAGAAPAPDLHRLIEAHRSAYAAMDRAAAAYSEAEAAAPRAPLVQSIGRAYDLIIGRDEILSRIAQDYDFAAHGLRGSVGKIVPQGDLEAMVRTIEQKKAENLAAAARVFEEEDASPAAAAERAWQEASSAEADALMAVLACPCRTIEDMAEKSRYLLAGDYLQGVRLGKDEVATLLRASLAAVPA